MIAIEEIGRITPDNLGLVTVLAGEDLGQYAQMKEKLFQVIGFNKDDLAYSYFDLSKCGIRLRKFTFFIRLQGCYF